jgi:hypothetical protein
MFYPRFDHDITESEALDYLEFWITRYYVPNPYTGKDGFKDLKCPTYVLKSLYDYVVAHPDCNYSEAYKAVFHEAAKNNDDIVRNYINNYSKVLSFSKNGRLNTTGYNASKIFKFMDKNDKKGFFDSFSKPKQISLMDKYLEADIEERTQMFYNYLIHVDKSESSARQYAFLHPKKDVVLDSSGYLDKDVPPIAFIEGVDLVTEGIITITKVLEYANDYLNKNQEYMNWFYAQDGASLIAQQLFENATDINFFVGCAMNNAHQGEETGINFTTKMHLIDDLADKLKTMGKNVRISYF